MEMEQVRQLLLPVGAGLVEASRTVSKSRHRLSGQPEPPFAFD